MYEFEELKEVYGNLTDDVLFYLACTDVNIMFVEEKDMKKIKTIVQPLHCRNMTQFKNMYMGFLNEIKQTFSRHQTKDIKVYVPEIQYITKCNNVICGFLEIFYE